MHSCEDCLKVKSEFSFIKYECHSAGVQGLTPLIVGLFPPVRLALEIIHFLIVVCGLSQGSEMLQDYSL